MQDCSVCSGTGKLFAGHLPDVCPLCGDAVTNNGCEDRGEHARTDRGIGKAADETLTDKSARPLTDFPFYHSLQDTFTYEWHRSRVLEVLHYPTGDGDVHLLFDTSIFHPQGGGQPTDNGHVWTCAAKVPISMVKFHGDKALHTVQDSRGMTLEAFRDMYIGMEPGVQVSMSINAADRLLFARFHTAAHLLCNAVKIHYGWLPTKAYMFPEGPYMEFAVPDPDDKAYANSHKDEVCSKLTAKTQELVDQDHTGSTWLDDDGVRVVAYDGMPWPCGGTHLPKTKGVGKVFATKMKFNKTTLKVSYNISE